MIVRKEITPDQPFTPSQIEMLNALAARSVTSDENCPELTPRATDFSSDGWEQWPQSGHRSTVREELPPPGSSPFIFQFAQLILLYQTR